MQGYLWKKKGLAVGGGVLPPVSSALRFLLQHQGCEQSGASAGVLCLLCVLAFGNARTLMMQ